MLARLRTRLALATALGTALLGQPAAAQDASELVVRLGRIENQSRVMAGQIETLQYENRQLKEQLRKFQEDVEFRLNEGKGKAESKGEGRGAGKPAPAAAPASGPAGTVNGVNPGSGRPGKRGDAFDPSQTPGAPGAPMQLGSTQPSAPLPPREAIEATQETTRETTRETTQAAEAAPRPQRLPQGAIEGAMEGTVEGEDDAEAAAPGYDQPVDLRPPARTGAIPARPSESVAATRTSDPTTDYEAAVELYRGKQYEQAEMGLRQFIQSHPRDNRVAGATYWLGESYLARGRNREAAEQFLKVSTDYARSAQAPDAMLKLGVTLAALGAREQACATLAELDRKFPNAGSGVRQGVTREQKRARCGA
ncbi:tol-pal system protein YbgF [Methylobacterium sp. E-065]|uniref:tol-pal system protein YbgF n=1 Tax=Methylobacterium sp. E-065 TaxID=2836583 RepID=UPI001FBA4D76|nr:tol-pal system protein YbgF [Methylobacterium sp. E-065]MCJ2017010.1 tol-pal system protein YbgF [Methylobacterium sp. E-065]